MPKKPSPRKQPVRRLRCEGVEFAEVEFPRSIHPRVVVRFSEGLSLLLEDEHAVGLAADFIVAFRGAEDRIHDEGGRR